MTSSVTCTVSLQCLYSFTLNTGISKYCTGITLVECQFSTIIGTYYLPLLLVPNKFRTPTGNLAAVDVGASVSDMSDPYGKEPRRHVALKPSSRKPFNAEPPLPLLADSLITPK